MVKAKRLIYDVTTNEIKEEEFEFEETSTSLLEHVSIDLIQLIDHVKKLEEDISKIKQKYDNRNS